MIAFKNITLQVHRQRLLDGTSLHVDNGEKVVVRGASGSGKSSLLKSTVGAVPIDSGSVCVDGLELSAETVAGIRARIAFIGQEPILGAEKVQDALLLPFSFKAHRHNLPQKERIHELIEQLHLDRDVLNKPCARISGGEKQRIAIIRALLLNKTIFLTDEVTSALDPESRSAVMEKLFSPEITLLSVSHDPEWIKACDRSIGIIDHQLIEGDADQPNDNPSSAIQNPDVGGRP
jgi:putative ABC transport system ATP-binding protein